MFSKVDNAGTLNHPFLAIFILFLYSKYLNGYDVDLTLIIDYFLAIEDISRTNAYLKK